MTEPSGIETLLECFPSLEEELLDTSSQIAIQQEAAAEINALQAIIKQKEAAFNDLLPGAEDSYKVLEDAVQNNEDFDDETKIALKTTLSRWGIVGTRYTYGRRGGLLGTLPFERLARASEEVEATLRVLGSIATVTGEPVLYAQILSGSQCLPIDEDRDWARAVPTFDYVTKATTLGNGVELNVGGSRYDSTVKLDIEVPEGQIDAFRNFIIGSVTKSKDTDRVNTVIIGSNGIPQTAADESRAESLCRRSIYALQSNVIFVGEVACSVFERFMNEIQTNPDQVFTKKYASDFIWKQPV